MKGENHINKVKREISDVLDHELENIDKFCMELAEGKIKPC
jgi:S-adenosylmethionine synthetase